MTRAVIVASLVLCLAAISTTILWAENYTHPVTEQPGKVLNGTLVGRNGNWMILKTDEGKTFAINPTKAEVFLDNYTGNALSLRVGDRVRVFGAQSEPGTISASRVRVFLSATEASARSGSHVTSVYPRTGAGPSDDSDVRVPNPYDTLGSWQERGLVASVSYGARTFTVTTSMGQYVIDVGFSAVVSGNKSVSMRRINQGDAVRVWGDVSGLNKIRAYRVEIIGDRGMQDAELPMKTISVSGVIINIEHPSFLFRIRTESGEVRVMVDQKTFIHFGLKRKAFMNLALGDTVKVTALGNLASGYVASEVQIVSSPRGAG